MTPFKVLVVDDEPDFLETIVRRLEKKNLEVDGAYSGEEAIELISEDHFDVIVLDIKMPGGMDGIETLREIKLIQPQAEVILLTGHASVETSIVGMREGAFDYLLKPVKFSNLVSKIVEALKYKFFRNKKRHDRLIEVQIQELLRSSLSATATGK